MITAGVDEVGRGCLAGPVVSAAVVLKKSINLNLLKDSKKISFNKIEEVSEHIKKNSYYALGIASVEEILNLNILQASLLSMKRAIEKLEIKPGITLIDGNFAPKGLTNYKTIINDIIKIRKLKSKSHSLIVKKLGMACSYPGTFNSSVHAILSSTNYQRAILKTIKAGGCNCSRANFIGAYFAALKGFNSIPKSWIKKTVPAKKILNQN